jgi:hypothetical protein
MVLTDVIVRAIETCATVITRWHRPVHAAGILTVERCLREATMGIVFPDNVDYPRLMNDRI